MVQKEIKEEENESPLLKNMIISKSCSSENDKKTLSFRRKN